MDINLSAFVLEVSSVEFIILLINAELIRLENNTKNIEKLLTNLMRYRVINNYVSSENITQVYTIEKAIE
jgi:hypothetical protein